MKRKIIVPIAILLLVISAIGTTTLANQIIKDPKQINLKIVYENKLVFNEDIDEDQKVIIKNDENHLQELTMKQDEKITLDNIQIPNGKIISYWKSEEDEDYLIITPVLIDEKDFNITFYATSGGKLNDNIILAPTITMSVEEGTMLKDILPEVQHDETFKHAGWYTVEENEIEIETEVEIKEDKKDKKDKDKSEEDEEKEEEPQFETKIEIEVIEEYQEVENIFSLEIKEDKEYYAILYPDINNNNQDDRNEVITVTVDFNLNDEIIEQEIHVGQPIRLSRPTNDNYVFIDWYLDENFTEKYLPDSIFTEDTSIYAKWKTPQQIADESGDELITEKRISDEVEVYLMNRNEEIYRTNKRAFEEESEARKEEESNEVLRVTEKSYSFKNFNVDQTFLITFQDGEDFLFSVALPYGRTIELLSDDGQKVKEYAVRQNATIDLSELINNSDSLSFESKTIKRNNAKITQIFPTKNNKGLN